MKVIVIVFFLCFICACSADIPNTNSVTVAPAPVPTASIPRDGNYTGRGVVTKVDVAAGTISIDHEAIEEVMPQKMTMIFNVKDKSILKDIKAGDKIEFVLEYKHPTETVTSIKKLQ